MRMLLLQLKYVKCVFHISNCAMPKLLIAPIADKCGLDDVEMIAFLSISNKLSAAVVEFSTSLYFCIFVHYLFLSVFISSFFLHKTLCLFSSPGSKEDFKSTIRFL